MYRIVRSFVSAAVLSSFVVCLWATPSLGASPIFSEDFNSVPLGFNVDEGRANPDEFTAIDPAFTHTPPAGWMRTFVHDSVGDPAEGVEEFEGWSFVTPTFWLFADGQQREQFVDPVTGLGSGVIAVADPDEWDDVGDPDALGFYNTFLKTSAIPLAGADPNSAVLSFSSSWRDECCDDQDNTNDQTAVIRASYDGGAFAEVLRWQSNPVSPFFKDDATNESVNVPLNNPGGAGNVVLEFALENAGNDWWWAVDNLAVNTSAGNALSENFDGLTLGPNVDEGVPLDTPVPRVYSPDGPPGWTVDRSAVPNGGVTEFRGWNFLAPFWWNDVAGQGRNGFTNGSRVIVVADGDEWDDDPNDPGNMDSTLSSPPISLAGVSEGTAMLMFDSSWLPEEPQTAMVMVSYDGGAPIEVLNWSSNPADPNFHADAPNETVMVGLHNPGGASEMVISWRYVGGNNWWWSIDNVKVLIPEPSSFLLASLAAMGLAVISRRRRSN